MQVHDKAYKRFLKQKEEYDRIEAELRNREEQYEATRQHAQAQTEVLAQKSLELNELRAQKAADDVSGPLPYEICVAEGADFVSRVD